MDEGSTEVDNGSIPLTQQDDSGSQDDKSQTETTETTETTEGEDKTEYTEKGTKKDPNPQSAVHQELANTKKVLGKYKQVLTDPKLLSAYAKEMGLTIAEAKQEIKEEVKDKKRELYQGSAFQTGDDVARVLNELRDEFDTRTQGYEKTIQELRDTVGSMTNQGRVERVANQVTSDITSIRSKYPVLDPKPDDEGNPTNPNYDPDLEKEISELFRELDFDERTQMFRGNVSLVKLADRIMRAAGQGKRKGSEEAQTVIQERKRGQIVTNSGRSTKDTSEPTDPSAIIASRIKKVMG